MSLSKWERDDVGRERGKEIRERDLDGESEADLGRERERLKGEGKRL